jgi:hypothetical protein
MLAGKRVLGLGAWLALGVASGGCGLVPGASGSGGYDGVYACTGTTVTPAGTTSGTGTFACSGGQCSDSMGAFTGSLDANGNFSGTDVLCQGCNPLPMSGQFSTTHPFTISGSSGKVSATFQCRCSGSCGGGSGGGAGGGGGPPPPVISYVTPTSGFSGDTLEVVGDDFPTSTVGLTVTVCGVEATIVATGLHAIIVTLPSLPTGSCDVKVATPDGSSTLGGAFTVRAAATQLATGLSSPTAIALDATSVYWLDDAGTVSKVPKAGGAVTVLASGLVGPRDLAVDATSVYWTEQQGGTVRKVGIDGGTVSLLASGLASPDGIAVDASSVYWADASGVKKMGLGGGAATLLSATDPRQGGARDIALAGGTVYFVTAGEIRAVPAGGGTTSTLFSAALGPQFIAADASAVYWTEYHVNSMAVRSVPVVGGAATTVLSHGWNVAPDPTGVFVAVWEGAIRKVPLGGGTPVDLATLVYPWGIATDATSVYWTDRGGSIAKLPK